MKAPRLGLLAVALTAIAAHARGLAAGFVYDDQSAVLENPVVRGGFALWRWLHTDFWGRLPHTGGVGTWRPIPSLSFWIDWHTGGGAAWTFHLSNLVFHVAASLALVLAVTRLGRPRVAVIAGLIFAALAANSEAVDGIVGRADVMAAGFAFLAWRCEGTLGASLACFAAMLCKESAAAVPVFLVVADLVAGRRFDWKRTGALVVTVAVYFAARWACYGGPGDVSIASGNNPLVGEGLGVRALTGLHLGALATRTILVPLQLVADYSWAAIPPDRGISFDVVVGAVGLCAVIAAAWLFRRRNPEVAVGLTLFVIAFAAIANVAAPLPAIFAERLLYLPAAGIAVALAGALARLPTRVMAAALALLVGGNLVRAELRAGDWVDDQALFGAAVIDEPKSARSWTNYGTTLLEAHRDAEAAQAFINAGQIYPGWAVPHSYAGLALARLGADTDAERELREAYRLDPDLQPAVFNLAAFLARHGKPDEAAGILRPYVARHPGLPAPRGLLEEIERKSR